MTDDLTKRLAEALRNVRRQFRFSEATGSYYPNPFNDVSVLNDAMREAEAALAEYDAQGEEEG